jgi:hypothetical protein
MKIIFSRKGFDCKYGGVPSPIFEDDRMLSLPIPSPKNRDDLRFRDVKYGGIDVGDLVEGLTRNRIRRMAKCHLDPDLRQRALRHRPEGWRPAFGQCDKAETQLRNEGVDCDDLFLFFGSFRKVKKSDNGFVYERESPTQHVIFGWLQVDNIYSPFPPASKLPEWAESHPHASYSDFPFYSVTGGEIKDTIYAAREHLHIPDPPHRLRGGGVFKKYHQDLCLTWPGRRMGDWRLPLWMYPF